VLLFVKTTFDLIAILHTRAARAYTHSRPIFDSPAQLTSLQFRSNN